MQSEESRIRQWLSTYEPLRDYSDWDSTDVVDLFGDLPPDQLFDRSTELFHALVSKLRNTDSDETAILVVPLEYASSIDLRIPERRELLSLGISTETPTIYRTHAVVNAWQSLEQYRTLVENLSYKELEIVCFYSCWRSIEEGCDDREYSRNLHYLWNIPGL